MPRARDDRPQRAGWAGSTSSRPAGRCACAAHADASKQSPQAAHTRAGAVPALRLPGPLSRRRARGSAGARPARCQTGPAATTLPLAPRWLVPPGGQCRALSSRHSRHSLLAPPRRRQPRYRRRPRARPSRHTPLRPRSRRHRSRRHHSPLHLGRCRPRAPQPLRGRQVSLRSLPPPPWRHAKALRGAPAAVARAAAT